MNPTSTVTPDPTIPDPTSPEPGPPALVEPDPIRAAPDPAPDRPTAATPVLAPETERPPAEAPDAIRVRFPPSPTGNPHVGLIRTALYNWAFARHHGGTLVLRIEDTDAARNTEQSYLGLLDALDWLGLDVDEGPRTGGPYGPYRQSERREIYDDVITRLRDAGHLYESFSTSEEITERHRAAGRDPKLGYDNADRDLSEQQRDQFREQGRTPSLRFRMPETELGWTDLVKGEISFAAGSVADPVLVRANGEPLYALTNPVDDAQMRITHVLRGEDLLSSTPRQLALHRVLVQLGLSVRVPFFGHLPYVMGEGNRKLSKRDPESSLEVYRERGFLPEGLLNYLALLGWSIGGDREVFSLAEMARAFDISRVSSNPARFDLRKAEAIDGEWIRRLAPDDFAARLLARLVSEGTVSDPPTESATRLVTAAAPLVQERVVVLADASAMLGFLFAGDRFAVAEAHADALRGAGELVQAAADSLAGLASWSAADIEAALRAALIERLGHKPRAAFAPVRIAITGARVSPPLFESLELLGREATLSRLRAALDRT